jgi:hypothetical protein
MRLPRLSCLSALQATPAGQRIAPVIVVIDKGVDLRLEGARQEVVFGQNAVFSGVWCQRSILPWIWGWLDEPRVCSML